MRRPRYFRRVFALFLAAAIAPAAAISVVYTSLAGAALRREAEGRLDSQAAAFARAVASIADSCARGLEAVASDQAVLAALAPGNRGDPAVSAKAYRRISASFPRDSGPAEASVISVDGSVFLPLGAVPPDRDLSVYGSWGIFRSLAAAPIAVEPRVAPLSDGSPGSFCVGIPIEGDDGVRLGYAIADVRRSAIAAAASSSGLSSGASLAFPSGKIVFDRSEPEREDGFVYEAGLGSDSGRLSEASASGAGTGFTVFASSPSGLYDGFGRSARNVALAGLAGAAVLASVLALRVSSSVTEPVLQMARSMSRVEAGDLTIRIEPSGDDELGDLARSFNAMTAEIDALLKREVERQELLREAELGALAAQMNPHFLHNTLASIKSLAKLGRQAEIAEVVSRLGKILRAGMGTRAGFSTIGESLSYVSDYLSIEKVRFGDRFAFRLDVDPSVQAAAIPPLTLEPLAENALTHGLERKRGHGTLRITGRLEGSDVVVSFVDDGPGMEPDAMEALSASLLAAEPPKGGRGMGLLGTNRRIALEYGDGYGIGVRPADAATGRGFEAILRVPARLGDQARPGDPARLGAIAGGPA
ncbi:MAG: histidine kinase [Spirochaetes bacterium]|nr:histidine kinase [Spirochaetota bacterium]MBU1082181.1 histidine kinase [Spirochaetota bacterium]